MIQFAKRQHENQRVYYRDYNILIYGDSTTWGFCPDQQIRLKSHERYPCILEEELNKNIGCNEHRVKIISEGLNGRTTNERDLEGNEKNERRQLSMNGTKQLLPILYSHKPVDIVIILLGINDCKAKFSPSPTKIANNIHSIIDHCISAEIWPIEESSVPHGPKIILCSPPCIRELTPLNKGWGFNQSSMNVSQCLHTHYETVAKQYDENIVHFINCNHFIQTGEDSVHIDANNNRILATDALLPLIVKIISGLQQRSRRMSVPSFTISPSLKHHAQESYTSNNKPMQSDNALDEDEESISDLETERSGLVKKN